MLLGGIVETSRRIAETSRRLEKIGLLSELLRQLAPEEVEIAVAILSGGVRQGRIGIGYRALQDAGAAAAPAPSITVIEADRAFTEIGQASGRAKVELLRRLMERAAAEEQQFLARLLLGELRQGALEGLMVEAVAKASGVALDRVRRAAMNAGDIAKVAHAALEHGEPGLETFKVQLFRPVQPMLAQAADDVEEALEELGEAALEYKMDGARIQVHRAGGEVVVYSRALNEVTAAVPEVVEAARALPVSDAILDGEVISLQANGRPQPFQVTMRRFGRKLDVERLRGELPLTPFFFDAIRLNGGTLIDEPQQRRFAALAEVSPANLLMPHTLTADPERAREFVGRALAAGHEGVMAKSPAAAYAAGARGQTWLKVKQPRTLDLVVLAAEWGNGRRRGWLSNLHLGARDTARGGFAMLGKTFKGLTDAMLEWQTQELLKLELSRDNWTVYVEPELVVEIAFNEIQVSPRYPSGLALRFARVKRYRSDKHVQDSDTFQTVQELAGIAGSEP
jgi:DNA ligase-1